MRQIKVRAMTFRRGPAQLTTAFRDQDHIRQVGTQRCDWLQAAEKPGAQGRKEGARRFRIKCGVGVRTLGGTEPCHVKLLCCGLSPASMAGLQSV